MRKIFLVSLFFLISLVFFKTEAYADVYFKEWIYRKDLAILKQEAQKVNENYSVFYACNPSVAWGMDKVPTMFVVRVDKLNKTLTTTAYYAGWNDEADCPEFGITEIPMKYRNYKLMHMGRDFLIMQQTDTGWEWGRLQDLYTGEFKHLGRYVDDPFCYLMDMSRPDNTNLLRKAFGF